MSSLMQLNSAAAWDCKVISYYAVSQLGQSKWKAQ